MTSFTVLIYVGLAFTAGRALGWAQADHLRRVIAKRDARIERLLDDRDYAVGGALSRHPSAQDRKVVPFQRISGRF